MARQTIVGTDTVKAAFLTKQVNNTDDSYVNIAEVVAGRSGEADLITKQNAQDALTLTNTNEVVAGRVGESSLAVKQASQDSAILAVTAANGSLISSNDTTPGFVNGKLIVGTDISFTENNDGGNETLTIATTADEDFTNIFMMGF